MLKNSVTRHSCLLDNPQKSRCSTLSILLIFSKFCLLSYSLVGTSVARSNDVFNNATPGANGPYDIVDKNAAKKGKTTLICKYV